MERLAISGYAIPIDELSVSLEAYARMHNMSKTLRTRTNNRKKLVAKAQRRERIYKRTAELSVTFCGEEKQWSG